jgi:SGNH domain (fused to AT3 domains)
VFKRIVLLAGAVLLVTQLSVAAAFASASSGLKKVTPVLTLEQLDKVLAASIKLENLPTDLIPTITQLSNPSEIQGSSYLRQSCDPYVVNSQADHPVPCWYGSTTAKRTVVIFGDSFVGNWIPALDVAGKTLGFKVAEFSFVGCNTPFVSPSKSGIGFDENEVKACIAFHANLPKAVLKLAPEAVIAADGAPSWGPAGNPSFIAGLNTAFDEMTTPAIHPIRILLGTGPHLLEAAPSCLATHPSNIERCNLALSTHNSLRAALSRDNASVQGAKLHLIPTYQWMCFHHVCPAVIGHIDVYADQDHLTIAFSKYLAVLLEKALTPLLSTNSS